MEFNISTFALEIVNFLILIWILQRLFYKPLLDVIAKRKELISQSLIDAENIQQQAEALRDQYENRLQAWAHEKQQAIQQLQQQLEIEKTTQLNKFKVELEQKQQQATTAFLIQQQQLTQQFETQALRNAAHFAEVLLRQAATPELEIKLCQMLLEQWSTLPDACTLYFQTVTDTDTLLIKISSAYSLPEALQCQLQQKLSALIAKPFELSFAVEPSLMAGLAIDFGGWMLNANLQHELICFTELADGR